MVLIIREPVIRIDHVTFSYGEENESASGVQDINLNIEDGQFIVLVLIIEQVATPAI